MKNLLFLLIVVLITNSFSSCIQETDAGILHLKAKTDKTSTTITHKKVIYKSLNGVKRKDARKMIKFFDSIVYKNKKLSQMNFWFGKPVINDIVTVIKDDSISMLRAKHSTDGIRIYFASDTINPSKVSIILVTTVDSLNKTNHHDYYKHFSNEHLFSDTGIAGNGFFKGKCAGANLYYPKIGGILDDISCKFKAHPHYIKRWMGRKMVNNFGTDVVNTEAEWLPKELFEDMANDPDCDGMRIYFAKHPSKGNANSEFINRDAFVIATTGKDPKNKNNHIDYFNCRKFKKLAEYTRIHHPHLFYSPGQDNGGLCPNICN